jgi:hypothetical protein
MGDMQPNQTYLGLLSTPAYSTVSTPIQVTLSEIVPNSWWADHDTVFTLCNADGTPIANNAVKFSTVSLYSADKNYNNFGYNSDSPLSFGASTAANNNFASRFVTSNTAYNVYFNANDSSFTMYNLNRTNATSNVDMVITFTLSAQADFSGSVYLNVQNDGLSQLYGVNQVTTINNGNSTIGANAAGSDPTTIEVANFTPTFSVTTSTSQVQIGYQSFAVSNIEIKEAAPGLIQNLTGNNTIALSLGEYGQGSTTNYMYFGATQNTGINDLAGSGITMPTYTFTGGNNVSNSALILTVGKKSTTAAADIVISNLIVNISRDVPQGYYNLIVGGSALTNNSAFSAGYTPRTTSAANDILTNLDVFPVSGLIWTDPNNSDPNTNKSYITVATQGANIPFTANVSVAMGADTATVVSGGISSTVSLNQPGYPACVAQPDANGNMMVPIRFISAALGVDPNNVFWDQSSQTCTVVTSEKTFTFTVDSSTATVNGSKFTLFGADGSPVKPELLQSSDGTYRMFLPVRALGHAFGLAVVYDSASSTAYINPDATTYAQFGPDNTAGSPMVINAASSDSTAVVS